MRTKNIKEIFECVKAEITNEVCDLKINQIHYDSRKIQTGDLFVAIHGFNIDGHRFLKNAQESGAVAAVVEETNEVLSIPQIVVDDTRKALAQMAYNFYRPEIESLQLIGITGTNGKTTTSFLVRSILEKAGLSSGLIGTISYYYGKEEVNAWNTTPESVDLYAMLFKMARDGQESCILEVSSHALSLHRVGGLKFKLGLFTNLSRDHMDFHKTEEEYFKAKERLFTQLSDDGVAVINIDDEYGKRLISGIKHRLITFGFEDSANITVKNWKMNITGMWMHVLTPKGELEIRSKLIGEVNVQNILAAVAVGVALNIDLEIIRPGIESVKSVPGRLESYEILPGVLAVIDYAHSPDALQKALQTLKQITQKRLIIVFGCGGDRDRGKRPQMGRIAEDLADYVIVTTDNPRTEVPVSIIDEILAGMNKPHKRDVVVDRRKAIRKAISMAEKGDVVLIAGKGHESYQDIQGVKYDFDEVAIIREAAQNV